MARRSAIATVAPDPRLVRRVYLAQYQQKRRGAISRTHRALIKAGYSISDQTIVNYVALPKNSATRVRDTSGFAKQPGKVAHIRHNDSVVANAKRAANVSYTVAVALTVVLLPVMCKDARLLVMFPVLLATWFAAGEAQVWYRKSLHFDPL